MLRGGQKKTLTIKLSGAGGKPKSKLHKLSVHLAVTQKVGKTTHTLARHNLTLKPSKKRHR